MDKKKFAGLIDSAVLNANAAVDDVRIACADAKKYKFCGLDVNLANAMLAKDCLKNSKVKLIVVVGYPLGASSTEVKMFEAIRAVKLGADEIDMVMNVGAFLSGDFNAVIKDIKGVVDSSGGLPVKVIIETGFLDSVGIAKASELVLDSGANFVKTCSGFGPRGVSVTDVKIIKSVVGDAVGIKASGNIVDAGQAIALVNAGATRIGSSHAKKIIDSM